MRGLLRHPPGAPAHLRSALRRVVGSPSAPPPARALPRVLVSLAGSVLAVALASPGLAEVDRDMLRFAAEMAQKGNWREARFRWERASAEQPDDARILNNLAVASEALGDPARARDLYARALSLSRGGPIADNAARSARFWKASMDEEPSAPPTPPPTPPAAEPRGRTRGDTVRVVVELPLPARLDVSQVKTLLVASFLSRDSGMMDSDREVTRFLRSEFRKRSPLQVLEVTPPPPIPEQTLDDLAANAEFWRMMGREFGADLIVSGQIRYDRRDASGFQEVEDVSPITGQKVRATRFVEQEQFTYRIDLLFLDGHTGALRFRDRVERSAVFRGENNDPITAFYQLSEAIAGDVIAVVAPRTRQDQRVLYRG